jgi:hypothetical protein
VVSLEGSRIRTVLELDGIGASFSANGRELVYLVLQRGPELDRARAEVRLGIQDRTRGWFTRMRQALARVDAEFTTVMVRDLRSGRDRALETVGLGVFGAQWATSGETLYLLAAQKGDTTRTDVYVMDGAGSPRRLTTAGGVKANLVILAGGTHALFTVDRSSVGVLDLETGTARVMAGESPSASADGSAVAFIRRERGEFVLLRRPPSSVHRFRWPTSRFRRAAISSCFR